MRRYFNPVRIQGDRSDVEIRAAQELGVTGYPSLLVIHPGRSPRRLSTQAATVESYVRMLRSAANS